MILDTFASGPFETNTYILGCPKTKEACVIDVPLGSAERILSSLRKHSLTAKYILLTHSHLDHIADAALLKSKLKASLLIHLLDVKNLQSPGEDGLSLFLQTEPVDPDGFLEEGELLYVGEIKIQVLCTPGHTPGGVSFYLPQEGMLFSGDTLFKGTMGRIDFPHSEPSKMWNSLKILSDLPPQTKVFPGHGPSTTIGEESWIRKAEERFN